MASNDECRGLSAALIFAGASLCTKLTGGAYTNTWMLNLISGGTVSVNGISTLAVGYLMSSTPITIGGPTDVYITETAGVTSKIGVLRSLTIGNSFI